MRPPRFVANYSHVATHQQAAVGILGRIMQQRVSMEGQRLRMVAARCFSVWRQVCTAAAAEQLAASTNEMQLRLRIQVRVAWRVVWPRRKDRMRAPSCFAFFVLFCLVRWVGLPLGFSSFTLFVCVPTCCVRVQDITVPLLEELASSGPHAGSRRDAQGTHVHDDGASSSEVADVASRARLHHSVALPTRGEVAALAELQRFATMWFDAPHKATTPRGHGLRHTPFSSMAPTPSGGGEGAVLKPASSAVVLVAEDRRSASHSARPKQGQVASETKPQRMVAVLPRQEARVLATRLGGTSHSLPVNLLPQWWDPSVDAALLVASSDGVLEVAQRGTVTRYVSWGQNTCMLMRMRMCLCMRVCVVVCPCALCRGDVCAV